MTDQRAAHYTAEHTEITERWNFRLFIVDCGLQNLPVATQNILQSEI